MIVIQSDSMSASGHKQTFRGTIAMSALPRKRTLAAATIFFKRTLDYPDEAIQGRGFRFSKFYR
jgi:hypothetical protein